MYIKVKRCSLGVDSHTKIISQEETSLMETHETVWVCRHLKFPQHGDYVVENSSFEARSTVFVICTVGNANFCFTTPSLNQSSDMDFLKYGSAAKSKKKLRRPRGVLCKR